MTELSNVLGWNGYLLFFVWICANRLGIPLPATPALLTAGALAGSGELTFGLVLLLAVVATLISDTVWYELGKRYGARILRLFCRLSLQSDACIQHAETFLMRHGLKSLLITKFLPGMNRTVLPLVGVYHVSYGRFLAFDLFGAAIWAGAYSGLGFAFSDEFERALWHAKSLGIYGAVLLAAVIVLAIVLFKRAQRQHGFRQGR
ncbi:MAG: DedA family protein [Terriglobales bacterium]